MLAKLYTRVKANLKIFDAMHAYGVHGNVVNLTKLDRDLERKTCMVQTS